MTRQGCCGDDQRELWLCVSFFLYVLPLLSVTEAGLVCLGTLLISSSPNEEIRRSIQKNKERKESACCTRHYDESVLGYKQREIALLLQWKTNSFVDSFDNTRFNGEG